jgi:hypothetical protein
MIAVNGATTEPRIRINRPDDENARCRVSRASDRHKVFSQCMQQSTTISTSNAITMPDKMRVEVASDQEVTALVYPAANRDQIGVTFDSGARSWHRSGKRLHDEMPLSSRRAELTRSRSIFCTPRRGRRVPDTNNKPEACFQAVVETIREKKIGRGTLVIVGKSMGGRIASQIAAAGASDVEGLVSLGYPLHAPGKVDQLRAKHLSDIKVPMLFVQGSRDTFGTPDELRPIIKELKAPADP